MKIKERAEQIADRFLSQIKFTYADFDESYTSPFPVLLYLDVPTAMLREYASLNGKNQIPKGRDEESKFLTNFWKETGLAEKLMTHKDANKYLKHSREMPIDMLEYLTGENVYVNLSLISAKRNLQSERIEIEVQDLPILTPHDEEG